MKRQLILWLLFAPAFVFAQNKQITLEDIYKKGTFRGEFVQTVFDSTKKEPAGVKWEEVKDEQGAAFGRPENVIANEKNPALYLATKGTESIYRRSSKAFLFLYNSADGKAKKLAAGKVLHPSFSPDGNKVAYVSDNNLFIYDINTGATTAITMDGEWNKVINGNCDWVYEEEFEFTQAYEWSAEGNYLAYYRFDESKVQEYSFTMFDNGHNKTYSYKYPKAGDDNSIVDIYIYDVKKNTKAKAEYEQGDIYIPRIKWTLEDNKLVVYWMNRHQNQLKLLSTDAITGKSQLLYEENNKYFVEVNDDWWFLKDKKNFLFTSEMSGFRQLYLYSLDGKSKTQITKGNYEITEVNGVDEKNKKIYFTLAYPRPMDRNIFVTDFAGQKTYALTSGEAWHRVTFNEDYTKFFDFKTDINTPQVVTLNKILTDKKKGIYTELEKTLSESAKLKSKMSEYGFGNAEFIRVPNTKGDTLNGWMLKPAGFDASKKYPVLFCNYGGPGSQQVANRFGSVTTWHQLLAQKGFIVVSFDNTGTGYRGEEFKKKTYLQLGKYEIEDQIDAAAYLGKLPYVDSKKIGHWGWSFGGFMSSLAITKGADVFSAAIAVAPVTNWRFYDNIYTERYMRTPKENPKGYDDNSPVFFTDKIKGKYLLIHGTADDNVHFQNSTQMVTSLVNNNIDFESAYYPNKNHGISGKEDNTTFHLWSKMTRWVLTNLGNDNTKKD
jgi:dipeptidyl-peptidase-4